MTLPMELEIFTNLATDAVAAAVLVVSVLHSARFVVRLLRWLVREVRKQAKLLIGEAREFFGELAGRPPLTPDASPRGRGEGDEGRLPVQPDAQ